MIVPQKVRSMTDTEKMHYYLKRLINTDLGDNAKHDAITVISELLSGVPVPELYNRFALTGNINTEVSPAIVTIDVPDTNESIEFELSVLDRDQFANPVPEAVKPIKSMLPEDEIEEIKQSTGIDVTTVK